MWRANEIGQSEKGVVRLERFSILSVPPYVSSIPEIWIGHEVFIQCLFVNELSASYVDKDPVFLHLRQPLSVDDPCGLTCQRKRQDYSIGILQKNRQSTRTYEELDAFCR